MKPKKIIFHYPVEVDGETFSEVTMRPGKARDRLAAQKTVPVGSPEEAEPQLFANLCEVPVKVVEELYDIDYNQLMEAYQSFLVPPPKTSEKPA